MCMDNIDDKGKKLKSFKGQYGWKIFKRAPTGGLLFEFQKFNKSTIVLRKKWLKTTVKRVSPFLTNFNIRVGGKKCEQRYRLGFHVYLSRPYDFNGNCIKKVRWKGVIAVGEQDGYCVVVANQLRVS